MNSWHSYSLVIISQVTALTIVASLAIACFPRRPALRHAIGTLALSFVLLSPLLSLLLPRSFWLVGEVSPAGSVASTAAAQVEMPSHLAAPPIPNNSFEERSGFLHDEPLPAPVESQAISTASLDTRPVTEVDAPPHEVHHQDESSSIGWLWNLIALTWAAGIAFGTWRWFSARRRLQALAISLKPAYISSRALQEIRLATGAVELPALAVSDWLRRRSSWDAFAPSSYCRRISSRRTTKRPCVMS